MQRERLLWFKKGQVRSLGCMSYGGVSLNLTDLNGAKSATYGSRDVGISKFYVLEMSLARILRDKKMV